jgi:hypothetical protein
MKIHCQHRCGRGSSLAIKLGITRDITGNVLNTKIDEAKEPFSWIILGYSLG